ncbi:MAG: PH domain-containing protein [Kangiellaceae bacterium]|nr:PH domain-containing protein [Kangiellaceae bacterium]
MPLINNIPENAQRLHPDSIKVSRITGSLVALIPLGVSIFIGVASGNYWVPVIGAIVALLVFMVSFVYAKKSYDYSYYWLADEGLYIQKGVLWRKKTLVPKNRVQHTDVSQGPLERKYQLAKLTVHTAGTRDASVDLSGIAFDIANELRGYLLDEEMSDAV